VSANINKKGGKSASKMAEEIFFMLYLKDTPMKSKAIVLKCNPNVLELYLPDLGEKKKMFTGKNFAFSIVNSEEEYSKKEDESETE
jgi:hypothetical protein